MDSRVIKIEETFISHDDVGEPIYGFVVRGNMIQKFVRFKPQISNKIILPVINKKFTKINNDILFKNLDDENYSAISKKFYKEIAECELDKYARGIACISFGCFKGINKLVLDINGNYSIALENGCFESQSDISLILPKDMAIFQIEQNNLFSHNVENINWLLIAHKNFKINGMYDEYYLISKKLENCSYRGLNFNIKYKDEQNSSSENFVSVEA